MPLRDSIPLDRVRTDFDAIAGLADAGDSGTDRFNFSAVYFPSSLH